MHAYAAHRTYPCSLFASILSLASPVAFLQGSELHQTLEEMRAADDTKYTKSHKKFKFFDADASDFVTRDEFAEGENLWVRFGLRVFVLAAVASVSLFALCLSK